MAEATLKKISDSTLEKSGRRGTLEKSGCRLNGRMTFGESVKKTLPLHNIVAANDFYFPIRKDSSRHKQDIIPLFIKRVHNKQDIRYVTYLEENVSRDKKILAKQ